MSANDDAAAAGAAPVGDATASAEATNEASNSNPDANSNGGDDEKVAANTSSNNGNDEDSKEDEAAPANEDPTKTTPQEQRVLMKEVGYKMQRTGEYWYPVSKKWYNSWIAYTCFSKTDADVPGGLESLGNGDVPRPGPIDNSDLLDPENDKALKKGIEEHLTHEWVHSEKWELLQSWYGGGPPLPRKVYERGNNREKYICIFPKLVKVFKVTKDNPKVDDETKFETIGFPPNYSLKSMAHDFESDIPEEVDEKGSNDKDNDSPKVHIWVHYEPIKGIYPINKRITVTAEQIGDVDPKKWVEVPDDYLKTKLDDMKFENDDPQLIVEYLDQKDNIWPLAKTDEEWKNFQVGDITDCIDGQKGWYEVVVRCVGKDEFEGKLAVHYIGWAIKWDEWVEAASGRVKKRHTETTGPHRPRRNNRTGGYSGGYSFSYHTHDEGAPTQSGVVGLRNLGNTCFMNSTLQCLAQSPWLTKDYFLSGEFQHHINKKNPLGWKGKVAQAWAHLLADMFSDKYRTIAPRDFKEAIGEVAPRFMGYAQQDSQELLSFLLDGLHEDLNQIIDKPGTDTVESNGRPDKIVALESWRTYLRRNQSIIVDLMQGQLKSRVECPDCQRISITFDPYMFLSVPLPTQKYKVVEFTWIGEDVGKPVVYGIKMHKYGDIGMLKEKIARQFDVSKDELFVCDIWKANIHREYRRRDSVADINRKSDDIFVYYSKRISFDNNNNGNDNNGNDGPPDANGDNGDNGDVPLPGPDAPPAAGDAPAGAGDIPAGAEADPALPMHDPVDEVAGGQEAAAAGDVGAVAGAVGAGAGDAPAGEVPAGEGGAGGPGQGPHNRQAERGARDGQEDDQGPNYRTFVVLFQRSVAKQQYFHSFQRQSEEELMGYPLLVTFNLRDNLTMRQIRDHIWSVTKPFVMDDNVDIDDNDKPFVMQASWGFNNVALLTDSDDEFNLDERNMKFVIHFNDAQQYKNEHIVRGKRVRDSSAPAPIDPKTGRSADDGDDGYGRAITLEQCIDAYTEEEVLSQEDAWYCSQCKDFKCAKKKLDMYNSPDLLIIHLKRFSYTRQWRDRINTLVKFPIEGLDLKNYLVDAEAKKVATYDLYAISNHMGGLGGGHYTAYAKNIFNQQWYHLDDSRASPVHNVDNMVSSAAYVLYYKKRYPAKIKHRASRILIPDETVVNELNNPDA